MLTFEDNVKQVLRTRNYIYRYIERKKNKEYKDKREKSFISKAKKNFKMN